MREPRRFPPPWSFEDIGAAFVVSSVYGPVRSRLYAVAVSY